MHYMKRATARPTIVLADDHAGMLKNVSQLLSTHYDIVAAVDDGMKAVEAVVRFSPDVALLDIAMPELDGFEAAHKLRKKWPNSPRLMFLTVFDDESYISAALEIGVMGYVLKSRIHSDLIYAVEQVLAGHVFISSSPVNAH